MSPRVSQRFVEAQRANRRLHGRPGLFGVSHAGQQRDKKNCRACSSHRAAGKHISRQIVILSNPPKTRSVLPTPDGKFPSAVGEIPYDGSGPHELFWAIQKTRGWPQYCWDGG
jgi:hypothetical protein